MSIFSEKIKKSILKDRSKENIGNWAKKLKEKPDDIDDVISLIDQSKDLSFRIIWMLGHLSIISPGILNHHIIELYKKRKSVSYRGYDREFVKILCYNQIPEALEGEIIDQLFHWLCDGNKDVAVKVYSMELLYKVSQKYPELKNELKEVLLDQMDKNTIAFKTRAGKIIQKT